MSYWALVITQANKERLATQNISNQGYEYYLPMFREKIVKDKIIIDAARILFPRYLFVKVKQQWASLTGTYGVSGLVMDRQCPKVVPESVVQRLKEREDNGGFVVIGEVDEVIKRGSIVSLTEGPFKDSIGIFQGMSPDSRAIVLFRMLGGDRELKIKPTQLMVV